MTLAVENMVPEHVAIIMDGNGRWAQNKHLPRLMGHRAGVKTLHKIVKASSDLGIKYLTVYAFSTENWKRSNEEVNGLMLLALEYLRKEIKELHENGVKLNVIGDITKLPKDLINMISECTVLTQSNTKLVLNIALNYGSRDEIAHSFKNIIRDGYTLEEINEDLITKYLYTKEIPDPDLMIRTGGEKRLSNFILWQSAYTELFFVDTWWPDFDETMLKNILDEYNQRERRFGFA